MGSHRLLLDLAGTCLPLELDVLMKKRWSGPEVATIDMLLTIALIFLALSLVKIEPPVTKANDVSICTLAVDITWPDGNNADVDLWVQAPGDRAVGYAAKDGKIFNLVRDDLGSLNDSTEHNFERACARGLPDGEYVVNVDLFSRNNEEGPVPVVVVVSAVNPASALMAQLLTKTVTLKDKGEVTVFRFQMRKGEMVMGSINVIPKALKMEGNR